ncbi:MAG: nuclear transport factor 2 family protein [Chitinophagaceae bacterium]|nr:MAG: nuclear transport factor 2 family protein [Chitinophagaceae bacterium]
MDSRTVQLVDRAYAAFNSRDIDGALSTMSVDIEWPMAFDGGYVQGHDAVREYWTRQWNGIDPTVEPIGVTPRGENSVAVTVHQLVKDLDGTILADGIVTHVYTIESGLFSKMEIEVPST